MQEILSLSNLLDYGVLGVLALILFFVGKYTKSLIDKLIIFMESQAQGAIVNQQAQLKAWKELTMDYIENQMKTAESLRVQSAAIERMLHENGEAHTAIMKSLRDATTTFVRWHEQGAQERKLMLNALQEALDQAQEYRNAVK